MNKITGKVWCFGSNIDTDLINENLLSDKPRTTKEIRSARSGPREPVINMK